MTQPESPESVPKSGPEAAISTEPETPEPEEPQPEPWTPERVSEWNAYYDLYVMLGVLLLVFVVSANRIANSSLWTQLQLGRTIAATGKPVLTDEFSYTKAGATWVNVPWLFQLSHAAAHKFIYEMAPSDPTDRATAASKADQYAAGALVALDALARLLTAVLLLSIRRAGPGRWWSALCVVLALGVAFSPLGGPGAVMFGGLAGPGMVDSRTWGLLLLAVELWLIHRAVNLGRAGALYAIVPVFILWANVDESFLIGLIFLAAAAVGRGWRRHIEEPGAPGVLAFLGVLVVSALACLANPSVAAIYPAAAEPLLGVFRPTVEEGTTLDQLSYFGSGLTRHTFMTAAEQTRFQTFYAVYVLAGFGSFLLNWRRFSLARFLVYAAAAVLWAMLIRYSSEFALVFAATMALNGQEWYHDRLGTGGRLGVGWWLWSTLGRAATIVLVFLFVGEVLTGYGTLYADSRFGFGYDPDDFAFEAADFLKAAPLKGNVLNTTLAQGDALIWRAAPARKTFIDSRRHLFGTDLRTRLQKTRKALSEDDAAAWKPLLDEYRITAVMIHPDAATKTQKALSNSRNWVPFYDDGNVALFGRTDAPADDLKFFQENRLEPESLAFRRSRPTPATERPPTPATWMDTVFQSRFHVRPQPHTEASRRWLMGADPTGAEMTFPDPARCLLAIREARTALASKPDDPRAFRLLAEAYRTLMIEETALLMGIKPTAANAAMVQQVRPRPDLLAIRTRQRTTALSYAIQTTPPPANDQDRQALIGLNLELYQLFLTINDIDLARDRLQFVLEKVDKGVLSPEARANFSQELAQLNEQVNKVRNQMDELQIAQPQQFGSPLQLAGFAMSQGMPGLALRQLEEAERTGTNPALVKPQLVDLYCDTGQPEKAVELLGSTPEDPSFGNEPGIAAMRHGRAYFLIGNADYAATIWEKFAMPRLRFDRTQRALSSTPGIIQGDPKGAASRLLEIPEKINQQASWEFEAGLARLEGGTPDLAAGHFTKALTLAPSLRTRPIVAYYLEKMGKPVPPPKPAKNSEAKPTTPAPATPAATKPDDKPAVEAKDTKPAGALKAK